jgi:hypothetical protein
MVKMMRLVLLEKTAAIKNVSIIITARTMLVSKDLIEALISVLCLSSSFDSAIICN